MDSNDRKKRGAYSNPNPNPKPPIGKYEPVIIKPTQPSPLTINTAPSIYPDPTILSRNVRDILNEYTKLVKTVSSTKLSKEESEIRKEISESTKEFIIWSISQTKEAAEDQRNRSKWISIALLTLFIVGLSASIAQFILGIVTGYNAAAMGEPFKLSMGNFSISSNTFGTIILSICLGFFFLYLRYVFTIRNILPTDFSEIMKIQRLLLNTEDTNSDQKEEKK